MYCIRCHSAFSWNTGLMERGTVHNPEYYRWMRENGNVIPRDPLDIVPNVCNVIISYTDLLNTLRIFNKMKILSGKCVDHDDTIKILNMHRLIHHINYTNTIYRGEGEYNVINLREMRAQYLLNNISKEEFKKKLQMVDKKMNKSEKLNNIWNLIRLVLEEYVKQFTVRQGMDEGKQLIKETLNEGEKVKEFSNNSFKKVGKMFNMTYPGITEEWIQIDNWEHYIKSKKINKN